MKAVWGLTGVVVMFAAGVSTGFFRDSRHMPPKLIRPQEITAARLLFRRSILGYGAKKTYTWVKQQVRTRPPGQKHSAVSLFGEELYGSLGERGLQYCDDAYGFGCYHGFFQRAITQKGVSVVHDLDGACIAAFGPLGLGCPHGIGHGIAEFMGPAKILEALNVCLTLTYQGDWSGCQGGVFMEYNFPSEYREDQSRSYARSFDSGNPYDPCDRVGKRSQNACYFELASWWQEVLRQDYRKIGTLCSGVSDQAGKEFCFLGVGYHIVFLDGKTKRDVFTGCSDMPDPEAEMLCRAGAAFAYSTDESLRKEAKSLCEGLGNKLDTLCIQKSKIL